ncbi:MAG: peptide chain release factor N(5)-glutamine methyltransferase, partial [Christensenellales bacterium]
RIHDRCGTNFMFIVMFVSIIFFSLLGLIPGIQETWILRVGSRVILLPLVAGVSYEVLKILAKWDNLFVRILKAPGLLMQKITTKEPTPEMIEVGITAFETVRKMDADETIPAQSFNLDKRYSLARLEVENILHKVKDPDPADAEWIFSRVTGKKRSELDSLKFIKPEEYAEAIRYATERAKGIPLQYVFGDTEFYGLVLHVDERVLIPRPETELLAEEVVKRAAGKSVLDLCTGSGAIAIAVKKLSDAEVTASDVSSDALDVAKKNAEENGADIGFVQSDMFENVVGKYDIIVSNPPYIPTSDIGKLSAEVKKEPVIALDGGRDGLDYYRIIAEKAKEHLAEGGTLLLEVGIGQAESVAKLLGDYRNVEVRKDYNNIDRIIIANV